MADYTTTADRSTAIQDSNKGLTANAATRAEHKIRAAEHQNPNTLGTNA